MGKISKALVVLGLVGLMSSDLEFISKAEPASTPQTTPTVTIKSSGKIIYEDLVIDSNDILENAKDIEELKENVQSTTNGMTTNFTNALNDAKTEINTKINSINADLTQVVFVESYDATTKTLTLSKGKPTP